MTATSPRAFMMSAALHAVVAVLLLFTSLVLNRDVDQSAKIFEMVAGEGDNYMAKEAPALGSENASQVTTAEAEERLIVVEAPSPPKIVPAPPEPVPAPPEPAPPPPQPAPKTPAPKAETPPVEQPVPNFKKKILYEIVKGDAKAKQQIRREREAEAKRQAEEKKRMTLEEFNRQQKGKTQPATKGGVPKVAKVDGAGIAKGVVGGSRDNKTGGAGGKALKSDADDVLGAYYSMFKLRMREKFEPPPGLSDSLKATVEVRSNPDGSLSNPRIKVTSGSREFDNAVLAAIRAVKMPARPNGRSGETIEFIFTMREIDE